MAGKEVVFRDEGDIRDWVRSDPLDKARWVEPARGSTLGLPDCWVPFGGFGSSVHIELKLGVVTEERSLKFEVRSTQRKEIRKMAEDGLAVGFMVGVKGTDVVFCLPVTEASLVGNVPIVDLGEGFKRIVISASEHMSFWKGVKWIFFETRALWQERNGSG